MRTVIIHNLDIRVYNEMPKEYILSPDNENNTSVDVTIKNVQNIIFAKNGDLTIFAFISYGLTSIKIPYDSLTSVEIR